jgi:hypothetical protein
MSSRRDSAAWVHVGLVVAEIICVPAFLFELSRALGGNTLSWAYVFEWPLLGGYAIVIWRKMLREITSEHETQAAHDRGEPDAATQERRRQEEADPDLKRWNDYLARVHAKPGDSPPEAK